MFYIRHPRYREIDKIIKDWHIGLISKSECFIKIKLITKLKN
jgi:hypothetical protein